MAAGGGVPGGRKQQLVNYYERGEHTALGYRLGDTYLGAWGEADRQRITDPELRAWFIEGYLANMPHLINVDNNGIITRIDGVSSKK